MLLKRSLFNTFMLVTLVAVSSCVPKATEKKAVCGENESFNSVTRSCYSIVEPRYKPVATKSSDTLSEETPKTITLTYTDANKDQAISCKVSAIASNIEAVSPLVLNGGLVNKAGELYNMAANLAGTIPAPDAVAATAASNAIFSALELIRTSFSNSTIIAQLGTMKSQTDILLVLAQNHPGDTTIQTFKTLTQQVLLEFEPVAEQVINRCECSAGVCTTSISPKLHKSGASGFSYTITDQDGESPSKAVSLTIAPMTTSNNHLRPVAKSSYVTGAESNTSKATSINFTIPTAGDLDSTPASSFLYRFNGAVTGVNAGLTASGKGVVTNCMNLPGSTGLNDTTCTYTPKNGDAYTTTVPAASTVTIDTGPKAVTFTAIARGIYGDDISIEYYNLQDTNSPISRDKAFGLISSYQESFVRVNGNAISVFINQGITSSEKIVELINNHPQANKMVVASGGDPAGFPVATLGAVYLTGGVDAYDNVSYTVSNSNSTSLIVSSSNTAGIQINITATNDIPMVPRTYFSMAASPTPVVFNEEEAKFVDLHFKDVDNNSGFSFDVKIDESSACTIPTDALTEASLINHFDNVLASPGPGTNFTVGSAGALTCTATDCSVPVEVTPGTDFSADNICLYYRVKDPSGAESSIQGISIKVNNVNDAPQLSSSPLPSNIALGADTINEDHSPFTHSHKDIYVGPGGGQWEENQLVTVTLQSSNTSVIPNGTTSCKGYTIGTTAPSGTPAANSYYLDTSTYLCYAAVASGSTYVWELYPSLTAIPICGSGTFTSGAGLPSSTPSAVGAYYLDTTNNVCYKAFSSTASSWAKDPKQSHYKIVYIPYKNKSQAAPPVDITVTVTDDSGVVATNTLSKVIALTILPVDDPPVFRSFISTVETNEGGDVQSAGFVVDEDDGATTDEDGQQIRITEIVSDNPDVLPVSSIKIFYDLNDNGVEDTGEERINTLANASPTPVFIDSNGVTDDVSAHKIYFKLDPVDGVSGNANISVTISDGNAAPANQVKKTFSFIVHPIAALHGGWNNISSVGLKTDKSGAPVAPTEIQCNYNKSSDAQKCGSGSNCLSTSTVKNPHGQIVPTSSNVIYWDSDNKRCYRSTNNSEYSWVEFNTSCPVTRQTGVCGGNNCIYGDTPTNLNMIPSFVGQYVYNTANKTCYVSTGKDLNTDWQVYVPSKVTLAWKPFTMVGSGSESGVQIAGWNIYRREHGTDYNFKGGHLKNSSSTAVFTIADPSIRTFTDTTAIAGKVYFYVVRPVDNRRNYPTDTPEIFSEVRVVAAPENYAFVHRWIVNQEICNGMNITTTTTPNRVDGTKNFRCEYYGPGMIEDPVSHIKYYDYGKDLLVDTQELGCPYAVAPACTSNGCVGVGNPTYDAAASGHTVPANGLYYDRSSGTCYRSVGGSTWEALNDTAVVAGVANILNSALNAPLVNVTQAKAVAICSARTSPTVTNATLGATKLPNKKEYIGYSSHRTDMFDPDITDMEQGFSLNIQSRCNGSAASGLETAYTDSAIPTTSFIYSLPGTNASNIRSLYTGSIPWGSSKGTEACVSRFGIQDVYGNVAEWTQDQMNCNPNDKTCTVIAGGASSFTTSDFDASTLLTYGFNLVTGPFNDTNDATVGPDGSDTYLTSWVFSDQMFTSRFFSYPVALPITDEIDQTLDSFPWLRAIGTSAGITDSKLHEDGIIVNAEAVATAAVGSRTGSFAVGGSYLSGNKAGRFSSELIQKDIARPDVGLRCIIPVNSYTADPKHVYPY